MDAAQSPYWNPTAPTWESLQRTTPTILPQVQRWFAQRQMEAL